MDVGACLKAHIIRDRSGGMFVANECNRWCPVTAASVLLIHGQARRRYRNVVNAVHMLMDADEMHPLVMRTIYSRREARAETFARITRNTWKDSSSMHALPLLRCNRVVCGSCNS